VAPLEIRDVWRPKYPITPSDKVVTAGSCFAQHIGKALVERGFRWLDAERAPRCLSAADRLRFNYGIFSFRTSNIYTVALLRQWLEWAFGESHPPEEYWESAGRYVDPFRPTIEPAGFVSVDELLASRATTLAAIRNAVTNASVFVFTLGLTEAWKNELGFVYPICPGTAAGRFDGSRHFFRNYTFAKIRTDLKAAVSIARAHNSSLRILLTVSPVPLTATASGEHVLVATTYSKSILRAVAGDYANGLDYVDYFPSYELVTGIPFRAAFFEPNLRNVAAEGVKFVMDSFFHCMSETHGIATAVRSKRAAVARVDGENHGEDEDEGKDEDDIVCEEMILGQFNRS